MSKLLRNLALLMVSLSAAACIDDPTALEDGEFPLSEAEIRLLGLDIYQSILDAREVSLGTGAAARASGFLDAPPVARSPVQYNERSEAVVDCPGGGTLSLGIEIKGVVNDETDAGWIRLTLVNGWQACAAEAPDGPVRNGAPSVETVLYETSDGMEAELEGSIKGGIRISTGDTSALCVVNMVLEGWSRPDGSSYTRTTGTVCGESFDEEASTSAG